MRMKKSIITFLLAWTALLVAVPISAASLYFPHVDTTYGWQTEIALINTSASQSVTGTLRAMSNSGQAGETKAVTLSPRGRIQIIVANEFANPTAIGYIVFDSSSDAIHGYTKFYRQGQYGNYRVAVPAIRHINTSDIYVTHIDSGAQWWTGLSLVNTTSEAKTITITFNTGETVSRTINANAHDAFTIGGLFNNQPKPSIQSAVISNASGIIGLELFATHDGKLMEGIVLTDATASTLYYPHVVGGPGAEWWTGVVAYNPSDSPCTITVTPYSTAGTPLTQSFLTLAGKQKYVGAVFTDLPLPTQTAWFKIESTRPLSGFELIGTSDMEQLAAYADVGRTGAKEGVLAKIEKAGWTAIALVNTEATAAAVTLTSYRDNGTVVDSQQLTVNPYEKFFGQAVASDATYIAYTSDRNIVGIQLDGSTDWTLLDGLPALGGSAPAQVIPETNVIVESGMNKTGGVARQSTQTMTGSLPNPTGSTDAYQGKAYLVLNGDRIPLSVTKSTAAAPLRQARTILKDGKEYYLDNADKIAEVLPLLEARAAAPVTWVFSVTFSINAGPNTVSIEVYDLNNTLFARMENWNIVGAIEPTSMVVTLWWNTNRTDIDLHMSPDNGTTHCYYSRKTAGEMKLDYDNTSGYGPEHITIENATGVKTYKIKVYYYRDHNDNPSGTTPTTASVTASINGELKLSGSRTLTAQSTSSGWMSGAHVWDAGEIEVVAPNKYTVVLDNPQLSGYPSVRLTVTVTDPGNSAAPKVTGLTAANFFVVNAGKVMSPVTVAAAENVYTLTFTDILAGKRDLFVYVNVPAQGQTPMKGGLSNTKTYGTNYAVIAGLNEYPAQTVSGSWFDDPAQPTKFFYRTKTTKKADPATGFTVDAADFTVTLTDQAGGTNRAQVSVTGSGITAEGWDAAAGKYTYLVSFTRPANYLDYDRISATFKKEIWLTWCVKDTADLKSALLAKGTGMSSTAWDSANITTYLNGAATKATILAKIEAVAGSMQKYDLLLFHFSGHGSGMPAAGNAAQYLCAYEDSAWITVNDLQAKLNLIPSPGAGIANAIVLMDACHSGNFIGKDPAVAAETEKTSVPRPFAAQPEAPAGPQRLLKYRPFVAQAGAAADAANPAVFSDLSALSNVFVMAAQTGTSSAWDDGTLKNGVFTHYLVEGINVSGKRVSAALANSDHSVWISGEEAFNYLDPKVRAWVSTANGYPAGEFQHPQLQDNSGTSAAVMIYNW